MIEEIKALLGAANTYTDAQIGICVKMALAEVEAYCNRQVDSELEVVVERIAIIKLERIGAEAVSSESFSSVSANYIDGYPSDIMRVLNRKRKIKVVG